VLEVKGMNRLLPSCTTPIVEGMDVVNRIAEEDTDYSDRPLDEQKIKSMTVETFGVDYPEPEKC
jgi:peptidyl-prolyl cis-trans isomerase B (cyclophilin B)